MDKNKELTENLYNACKNWFENFECPLDEYMKTCQKMPCYFLCSHLQLTKESAKIYLESRRF